MGLNTYKPESWRVDTPENRAAMASMTALMDACQDEEILEGRMLVCNNFHSLLVDLDYMKELIPREGGALGIRKGTIRDITIISHVNRPVCFIITGFQKDDTGNPIAVLSHGAAREKCWGEYIEKLRPSDATDARVAHLRTFGAFADIGCGIISLLPIDAISVSRIDHPREWFTVGMGVRTIVKSIEGDRITLTQKKLLDTWEENIALFHTGETVAGIIRSIEPYGIFVELAPSPAGLTEIREGILPGQQASVYIKGILLPRMKIKLIVIDTPDYSYRPIPPEYFFKGDHMDRFVYSLECNDRQVVAEFL